MTVIVIQLYGGHTYFLHNVPCYKSEHTPLTSTQWSGLLW